MFLCDKCALREEVEPWLLLISYRSHGPCESCHKVCDCVDIPSSHMKNTEEKRDVETPKTS
jgi:hypothetical protein